VEQPTILIISDEPEFSHALAARWQIERDVPAFTLMSSDLCQGLDWDAIDMAIVGPLKREHSSVLRSLAPPPKPVLIVCQDQQSAQMARGVHPAFLVLRQHEGWLDALVLVSVEAVRRCEAVSRTQRAERSLASRELQATLGRYMLDTRHAMNNALTSVLGNAELLLLDTRLSDTVTSQVETIRNMALRMHEILQRFSSLEKELAVVEKQTENDSRARSRAVAG